MGVLKKKDGSPINYDDILESKNIVEKLSKGIDPISGCKTTDTSILHNKKIQKNLELITLILEEVLINDGIVERKDKRRKYRFSATKDQIDTVELFDKPVSISKFTYRINDTINDPMMKKLKATKITSWLLKEGYFYEIEHDDGKTFKVSTTKAHEIGIFGKRKENKYGRKYDVNMYDKRAQKFILENLNKILSPI
jgi:hypothetical protein